MCVVFSPISLLSDTRVGARPPELPGGGSGRGARGLGPAARFAPPHPRGSGQVPARPGGGGHTGEGGEGGRSCIADGAAGSRGGAAP